MTYLDLLSVKVLNGRVILFDEAPGNELDSQGRLAYSATAQHHHLEFAHIFVFFFFDWTYSAVAIVVAGGFSVVAGLNVESLPEHHPFCLLHHQHTDNYTTIYISTGSVYYWILANSCSTCSKLWYYRAHFLSSVTSLTHYSREYETQQAFWLIII